MPCIVAAITCCGSGIGIANIAFISAIIRCIIAFCSAIKLATGKAMGTGAMFTSGAVIGRPGSMTTVAPAGM